jgi:hypothetical protein
MTASICSTVLWAARPLTPTVSSGDIAVLANMNAHLYFIEFLNNVEIWVNIDSICNIWNLEMNTKLTHQNYLQNTLYLKAL